jgi:hypothetical protein
MTLNILLRGAFMSFLIMALFGQAPKQRITISSLEQDGIVLLPPSHPDFEAAFEPGRAKEYDELIPYTVVIKNNTDHAIIAYSVVWFCWDAGGRPAKPTRSVIGGPPLAPRQTRAVSFNMALEAGGRSWDTSTEAAVKQNLRMLSKQTAVDIVLDAAVFDDGMAVGPDTEGWIARWSAQMDAEKEVFTAAVESSSGDLQSRLRRLMEPGEAIVRERLKEGANNPGQFAALAAHSKGYADCVALQRGYFALSILNELATGNQPTIDNLRGILGSKRYPAIHRKNTEKE